MRCRTRTALSQLGVAATLMGRWTGVQIIIVTIIILFLSEVRLWRQIPGFPSRPGHTEILPCLHELFLQWGTGKNIQKLCNSLSSVFQTGLACCWRWGRQQSFFIERWDLPTISKGMDTGRKPSQVNIYQIIWIHYHYHDQPFSDNMAAKSWQYLW